jgi:hypothetical protein
MDQTKATELSTTRRRIQFTLWDVAYLICMQAVVLGSIHEFIGTLPTPIHTGSRLSQRVRDPVTNELKVLYAEPPYIEPNYRTFHLAAVLFSLTAMYFAYFWARRSFVHSGPELQRFAARICGALVCLMSVLMITQIRVALANDDVPWRIDGVATAVTTALIGLDWLAMHISRGDRPVGCFQA